MVLVYTPVANTPEPVMINPVPAVVEICCPLKSKSEPLPRLIVRTAPLVANVLPAVKLTVTFVPNVMFPTFVVAPMPPIEYVPEVKFTALFAVKVLV